MDLLRNYYGFKEDIGATFKALIEEFDLKLTEPYDGTYLLTGARCIIRLTYDRGVIGCTFKQITDDKFNPGYDVWAVDRHLYPVKQTLVQNSNSDWATSKKQLEGYSNIIQTKFKNILNGDFSWLNDCSEKQDREGQLTVFILGLNRDHPIYKKFWAGDFSWKTDVERYLLENNITLPG